MFYFSALIFYSKLAELHIYKLTIFKLQNTSIEQRSLRSTFLNETHKTHAVRYVLFIFFYTLVYIDINIRCLLQHHRVGMKHFHFLSMMKKKGFGRYRQTGKNIVIEIINNLVIQFAEHLYHVSAATSAYNI